MKEKASPLGYYTIGISALFLVGFLLLIIFGAQVYRDAVTSQDQNDQTRALRSYLITCSRSAGADDITLKDGAAGTEGQIFVIRDSGTDYGLQIYLHDGQLVENYGRLDAAPDPDAAQPIASTSVFSVEPLSEGTFAVTTDAGRILLHASMHAKDGKSSEGGEPR